MADVAKIVSLRGGELPPPLTPRPDVIEALERALEMARGGEIVGVVAVFVHSDDATSSTQHGTPSRSMLGMLEMSKLDLADTLRATGQ